MTINSEKSLSQRLIGSPAQIRADDSDLATMIFGSNFDAIDFGVKSAVINADCEDFDQIFTMWKQITPHHTTPHHTQE